MRSTRFSSCLPLLALACLLQGGRAQAEAPPPELAVGFTTFHLVPVTGAAQNLTGITLAGRYNVDASWSWEASLGRHTGSEDSSVDLRQVSALAGLRYTWTFSGTWQGFVHVLGGWNELRASTPDGRADQSSDTAFGAGAGVDFALTPHLALRAQEDYLLTHYSGRTQRNTSLFLGVAFH